MARFQRGREVVSTWVERALDDEADSQLWTQRNAQPAILQHESVDVDRAYRERQRTYLQAGWWRVVDPVRERVHSEPPSHPDLDHALRTAFDDATLAVYADWLLERGHPRGLEIANPSTAPDLGPLVTIDDWHRGFIRAATIAGGYPDDAGDQAVWELLRHPAARLLASLAIELDPWRDWDLRLVVDLLLTVSPPPLRRLAIRQQRDLRNQLGDLSTLSVRYPLLEDVELHIHQLDTLGRFDLPHCKRLLLRGRLLSHEHVAAILFARWPALEDLELVLPNLRAPADDLAQLEATLRPQLRRCVIRA